MGDGQQRFEAVGSGRTFELILNQLRAGIERGDLGPGEKLPPEPELARQFGVSRTVLREALKVLELSGYLDVRRGYGGGTFVAQPTGEEFATVPPPAVPILTVTGDQLLEVRRAIEPAAARLAARSAVSEALALKEAIREMEVFDDRPAHVLQAIVDFHVAVAKAARNPVFAAVLEDLRPVMYREMNRLVQDSAWRDLCRQEHERILKQIEAGQADAGEHAMRDHVHNELGLRQEGMGEGPHG